MARKLIRKNTLKFLSPEYKKVGLYELSFNEKNVRKLSKKGFARLKKKVLENVYEPLKVWKKGNIVLSGNQRLAVMRSLVENEGYEINHVNVAIYDVDDRTAKFIELSDNEHEGQYDLDKLVEEFESISELDLQDVLDPKLVKKLETKIMPEEDIDMDDDDTDLNVYESNTTDIIISNVPKTDSVAFYDTIDLVNRELGGKSQWGAIKVIFECFNDLVSKEPMFNLAKRKK